VGAVAPGHRCHGSRPWSGRVCAAACPVADPAGPDRGPPAREASQHDGFATQPTGHGEAETQISSGPRCAELVLYQPQRKAIVNLLGSIGNQAIAWDPWIFARFLLRDRVEDWRRRLCWQQNCKMRRAGVVTGAQFRVGGHGRADCVFLEDSRTMAIQSDDPVRSRLPGNSWAALFFPSAAARSSTAGLAVSPVFSSCRGGSVRTSVTNQLRTRSQLSGPCSPGTGILGGQASVWGVDDVWPDGSGRSAGRCNGGAATGLACELRSRSGAAYRPISCMAA